MITWTMALCLKLVTAHMALECTDVPDSKHGTTVSFAAWDSWQEEFFQGSEIATCNDAKCVAQMRAGLAKTDMKWIELPKHKTFVMLPSTTAEQTYAKFVTFASLLDR